MKLTAMVCVGLALADDKLNFFDFDNAKMICELERRC